MSIVFRSGNTNFPADQDELEEQNHSKDSETINDIGNIESESIDKFICW